MKENDKLYDDLCFVYFIKPDEFSMDQFQLKPLLSISIEPSSSELGIELIKIGRCLSTSYQKLRLVNRYDS